MSKSETFESDKKYRYDDEYDDNSGSSDEDDGQQPIDLSEAEDGERVLVSTICTYCTDDVEGSRIKCASCEDVVLCQRGGVIFEPNSQIWTKSSEDHSTLNLWCLVQCFRGGAEFGPHKKNHDYHIVRDKRLEVITSNGWTGLELINLLEAIRVSQERDWEAVSRSVETRTPEECEEMYQSLFMNGAFGDIKEHIREDNIVIDLTTDCRIEDKKFFEKSPVAITEGQAKELGYMVARGDFEKEFDNTAELLISQLKPITPGCQEDEALMLAHVDMFMRSMGERQRRKKLIHQYQLPLKFFIHKRETVTGILDKSRTKEEKDFEDKFCVFTQFMDPIRYHNIMTAIKMHRDLRSYYEQLRSYKAAGFSKISEAKIHAQNKIKQESSESLLPKKLKTMCKKKKKKKLKFMMKKKHALHRTPANIAAFNKIIQNVEDPDIC